MSIKAMKQAAKIMANARDWFGNDPKDRWDEDETYHELVDAVVDLHKAIKQAEKQEPVALEAVYETIIYWDEGGGKRSRRELARRIVALYTTPPKREWVGLTEPELHEINPTWPAPNEHWKYQDVLEFVRAIEAKLKEKNT